MSVKVRSQTVCPDCRCRQPGQKKVCKCGKSLKGVDRSHWVFIDHLGKKKAKKVGTRDAALEVARKFEARLTLGDFGVNQHSDLLRIDVLGEAGSQNTHHVVGAVGPYTKPRTAPGMCVPSF